MNQLPDEKPGTSTVIREEQRSMATSPTISIVVPVYNTQRYLQECLDSLLKQSLSDIEIICIDDGSTDDSPAMIDEAAKADARVKAIHQANAGVSAARNHGLELACGTYVLFVDSDDFIRHDTCELLHKIAERDTADIVVFGGKTFPIGFWADDCFAKRATTYTGNSIDALLGEVGSNPLMCNKLYRRSLLVDNNLRFNTELHLGEDNAFQFCTFPCARVVSFTPETLYFYRNHKDSAVMADDCDGRLLEHIKVVNYVLDTWRERSYFVGHEQAMLNWAIDFLYRDARNARLETRKQLADAFGGLIERCFTEAVRADIPQVRKDQLAFILESKAQPVEQPVVSVIFSAQPGMAFDEDSFHSLEVQDEQHFEILYVASDDAPDFKAMLRDDRCRTFATMSEAVAAARAAWVIFPGSICEYEPTSFRQLLVAASNYEAWAAQKKAEMPSASSIAGHADVVTFTDADGSLEHSDVFRYLHIDASTVLDNRQTFSAAELGDGVFHFASAAPYNKFFATDLVKACAERDPEACRDVSVFAMKCLASAQAILPTQIPLLTLRKPHFQTPHGIEDFVASCIAAAEEAGLEDARAHSLRSAIAAALCSLADAMRNPADAAELFCVTRKALDRWPDVVDEVLLPAQNLESLRLLLEAESSEAYLITHSYALLHRMGMANGRNLKQVGEFATQAELLRQEMDRFYSSVTYKAGRIVTALPRKLINLIRRKG